MKCGVTKPAWRTTSRWRQAAWIPQRGRFVLDPMGQENRLKRLRFRAWHRGTREADLLVGGFFARHHRDWSDEEIAWFEALLDEQDADILAWAFGTAAPPARLAGPMMRRLQNINYVKQQG